MANGDRGPTPAGDAESIDSESINSEAASDTVGTIVRNVLRSQERSLDLTQGWFEGVLQALRDQAENYAGMLRALESSLTAMERAISSQVETTRALKESLDASRHLITRAMQTQERNLRQAEQFLSGALQTLTMQAEGVRAQVQLARTPLPGPLATQGEAVQKLAQEWVDAYSRLVEASLRGMSGATGPALGGQGTGASDEGGART